MQNFLHKTLLITSLCLLHFAANAQCTASFAPVVKCDTVTFVDSSSWNGVRAEYFWDFGDGTNSANPNPVKIYDSIGTFRVMLVLTIRDNRQQITCVDSTTQTVSVNGPCCDASFSFNIDTLYQSVFVQAKTESKSSNSWDMGDGSRYFTQDTVNHTYQDSGTYTIQHFVSTVVDSVQYNCSSSEVVFVPRTPESCRSDWTFNKADTVVQFIANSRNASSYKWFFGDGDSSNLQNPLHRTFPP